MTARRPTGPLAALYRTGACPAARCGLAKIRWVATARTHPATGAALCTGAPVPLDAGRDRRGLLVLDRDPKTGADTCRPWDDGADDPDRPRYAVHWSGCHDPGSWRLARDAADPRGLLPPPPNLRRSVTAGPCAMCGTRHDNHYGQRASPLCGPCLAVAQARWSPSLRAASGLAPHPDTP